MSQYWFHAGKHTFVVGWDAPCNHFFATVWRFGQQDSEDPVYSTLYEGLGGVPTVGDVEAICKRYDVPLPDEARKEMTLDASDPSRRSNTTRWI